MKTFSGVVLLAFATSLFPNAFFETFLVQSFTTGVSKPCPYTINKVAPIPSPLKATAEAEAEAEAEEEAATVTLEADKNGIYLLKGKDDHIALLKNNPDKIVIIKFFAPWCRACKGLEPKYIMVSKDKRYESLPLVFAQMSVQNNKDYIKTLGVLALPSIHINVGSEGLVENFPCGPSKVPILKKKISQVVNEKVDPKTYALKVVKEEAGETEPCTERSLTGTGEKTTVSVGDVVVSEETIANMHSIPYFKDLSDELFETLMKKAKYVTFDAGSIIMKEGMPGRTFYVIDSGEVEISVRGAFEDPLTTPKGYLGAVVNRLRKNNYFGERSLITGQPRAASIKATEKTRCFTFDVDDIPDSSVLSGKRGATTERLQEVDDKYAVDYYNIDMISSQFKEANVMSQVRGSPNTPVKIKGVDYEEEDNDDTFSLDLLLQFKLLRHAARCFEYILKTNPTWGDEGESYRRSMLVSKLTPAQRFEFTDVFKLIDTSRDGTISMLELKRALETIDDDKIHTDDELLEMINKADPTVDGNTEISFDEFMGVMAEAEFYYLFKETFASLDKENSGYVQAGKLNKILRGLRDLISDDRKSIIDMDDKDMLIDYETFSRMMIGNI